MAMLTLWSPTHWLKTSFSPMFPSEADGSGIDPNKTSIGYYRLQNPVSPLSRVPKSTDDAALPGFRISIGSNGFYPTHEGHLMIGAAQVQMGALVENDAVVSERRYASVRLWLQLGKGPRAYCKKSTLAAIYQPQGGEPKVGTLYVSSLWTNMVNKLLPCLDRTGVDGRP